MDSGFTKQDVAKWALGQTGGGSVQASGADAPDASAAGADDAGTVEEEEAVPTDPCKILRAAAEGLEGALKEMTGFTLEKAEDKVFKKSWASIQADAEDLLAAMTEAADEYDEEHADDEKDEDEESDEEDEDGDEESESEV